MSSVALEKLRSNEPTVALEKPRSNESTAGRPLALAEQSAWEGELQRATPKPTSTWKNATFVSLAILVGVNRQQRLEAAIISITAFVAVLGGTITSTVVTTIDPSLVPHDFTQKATLSNVAQDVKTPHGRLWTTALVASAIMLLVSMYPFQLYRCWAPWVDLGPTLLAVPYWQIKQERWIRTIWVVLPNLGFVLTGAIPSLSGVQGYQLVLTGVHNTCAPLSMLFCMLMETIQLGFGENAFAYFFSSEATPVYGPLTGFQRVRVVTVCCAWVAGAIFVGVQAYLAFFPNRRYWLALVSYFGEVCGLILAFSMPALAGLENLWSQEQGNIIEETTKLLVKLR